MQINVKAEITIVQLYLACLLKYQSWLCTAIPFLKFIVLEKCGNSLILTFSSKLGRRWEVFELYENPHQTSEQHCGAFSQHPAHSLFPELREHSHPQGLPSFWYQTRKEHQRRQTRDAVFAPGMLSTCAAVSGGQGSPGARGSARSPYLGVLALMPYNGCWCQPSVFRKLFFLQIAPLGSLGLWLLVGFSSQEVWVRQNRRKEKLGQALSPCFFRFGQWLPHSIAGFLCLSSTSIWSWVSPCCGGLSCALLDISHWPLFPRWQ